MYFTRDDKKMLKKSHKTLTICLNNILFFFLNFFKLKIVRNPSKVELFLFQQLISSFAINNIILMIIRVGYKCEKI